jgi:hypothetical protein
MRTLLKSKLEKFIVLRASAIFVLLSVVGIALFDSRWSVLAGLAAGTVLSVFTFACNAWLFNRIICQTLPGRNMKARSAILGANVFVFNKLILLIVLFWAYSFDRWLFVGAAAGALTVPAAVVVNTVTEALGITQNHFFA